jgi:hypothetical protein
MKKKATGGPLPPGRGSVSARKDVLPLFRILLRLRRSIKIIIQADVSVNDFDTLHDCNGLRANSRHIFWFPASRRQDIDPLAPAYPCDTGN